MKAFYFSPTYSTKKIVKEVAKGYSSNFEEHDFTLPINKTYSLEKQEIAIIGVPVHMGRVPQLAIENIKKIKGNNTPIITIVVYGNRNYDDALLELNDICKKQGFIVIASATFIAEHSMNNKIATNRPNNSDLQIAREFGGRCAEKLCSAEPFENVTVQGNTPYKKAMDFPLSPIANSNCNDCGLCAEQCPSGAIKSKDYKITNNELCISCMRCVKECPEQARGFKLNLFSGFLLNNLLKFMCRKEKGPLIVI